MNAESPEIPEAQLEPFKRLILKEFGFSLGSDREASLNAGLKSRMQALQMTSLSGYFLLLERDAQERNRLVEHLTVNETYFFRESSYLHLMRNLLIPEFMTRQPQNRIRILSAGCSTGEEPYSIAMVLHERYGQEAARLFEITGVDLDTAAIRKAMGGVYGRHSFRGMDQERLDRYFEPALQGQYRIRKEIRNMVSFETANLRSSTYPGSMHGTDLIFYRNVSIYFAASVQAEVFTRLAECLNTRGVLIVSATETLHHNLGVLSLVEREGLFMYQKLPEKLLPERKPMRPIRNLVRSVLKRKPPVSLSPEIREPVPIPAPAVEGDVRSLFDEALARVTVHCPDQALILLKRLLVRDPAFIHGHTLMASLFLNSGNLEEAKTAADRALHIDSLCLPASLMLGLIACQKDEQAEALKCFREILYRDARCWPAHFYLAELASRMGEKRRALAAYGAALEILGSGRVEDLGTLYFPLRFHAEQFQALCRHKLDLLKEGEQGR